MTDYISFSLYGSDPKYVTGAIKNVALAPEIYPGWKPVVFSGSSVPQEAVDQLMSLGAAVRQVYAPESPAAMLWRYHAVNLGDAERVIFRDTDSRISSREAALVRSWVESDSDIHIIRDHPNHTSAILGGLWGGKAGPLRAKFQDLDVLTNFEKASYGFDQELIRTRIYRDRTLSRHIHDSFFVRELFSKVALNPDEKGSFLGEVFSEDDIPDPEGRAIIFEYLRSPSFRLRTQFKSFKNMASDRALDLCVRGKNPG